MARLRRGVSDVARGLLANKRAAGYLNLACAVLMVVTAIVYYVQTTAVSNFNSTVVVLLLAGAACAVVFALVPAKVAELGNLAAVGLVAAALAQLLINSINTFADVLSGITMFGSSGGIDYIIMLASLMAVALVIEIITCFMSRDAR